MLKITNKFADTTNIEYSFDVLSDILKSLRVSGNILFNEENMPPWAVSIPHSDKLKSVLKLNNGAHVVAFHYVKRGYVEITPITGNPITLEAGEIAICFGGNTHQLSQGTGVTAVPVEMLLDGMKNPFQPDEQFRARSTSLICGLFLLQDIQLNPLFVSLPPLLRVSMLKTGGVNNLSGVLEQLAIEIETKSFGSNYVIERLLELLCAEAIRSYLANNTVSTSGLLSGLRDPVVSRAISLIHAKPGDRWSVEHLAQHVAMSPSRFAARFSAALGDSPMSYVAKWRMNVAGRLLENTHQGIVEIANDVGYENVAAFNRAFKKHQGLPPAAWRSRQL